MTKTRIVFGKTRKDEVLKSWTTKDPKLERRESRKILVRWSEEGKRKV